MFRELTSAVRPARNLIAALAFAALATPALAATTIEVTEAGEGGGAMSLKISPDTVKAGEATFKVKNEAASEEHEMILVRLKSADQKIPFSKKKDRVLESDLESLGEVEDIKPGASGELTADLKPGTYLLFCNIKGHYRAGMAEKLTVTP